MNKVVYLCFSLIFCLACVAPAWAKDSTPVEETNTSEQAEDAVPLPLIPEIGRYCTLLPDESASDGDNCFCMVYLIGPLGGFAIWVPEPFGEVPPFGACVQGDSN